MTTYHTNLAAEFYVLSTLHRLGADASLTLGNRKAVDLVVTHAAGRACTIDVKGLAGSFDWPADNVRLPGLPHHFLVLVSFQGRIDQPREAPHSWIIPAGRIDPFIKRYRTRTVISRARVRGDGEKYSEQWWRLLGHPRAATTRSRRTPGGHSSR